MKISLAQINYHVGNFDYNSKLIIEAIKKARSEKSDIVLFSELAICGYPPHDLLEQKDFIEKCEKAINRIAEYCSDITAIIGTPTINKGTSGNRM